MSRTDEGIIAALLTSRSVKEAAAQVGISDRTMSRRLADPDFQQKLREAGVSLLRGALGSLPGLVTDAVDVLDEGMRSPDQKLRLRAADLVLRHTFRFLNAVDYDQRILRLEEEHEALFAALKR